MPLGRVRGPDRIVDCESNTWHPDGVSDRDWIVNTMLDRDGSLTGVVEVLGDTKPVGAKRYVYALADYSEIEPKPALARLFT